MAEKGDLPAQNVTKQHPSDMMIRNNNMLNCQHVIFEETDLKRASMLQLVIIMDELHDTKSRGRISGDRSGCNETGKDSQDEDACTVSCFNLRCNVCVGNSSTSIPHLKVRT